MNKKGFTLIEILVAVLIMVVLITMAMPMYERAIERSRKAEVSVVLKRIAEAKLRWMDQQNITTFPEDIDLDLFWKQVDVDSPSDKDFTYSIYPNDSYPNSVCAVRNHGDNTGTIFLYVNEDECNCKTMSSTQHDTICGRYCNDSERLFCGGSACEEYGMNNQAGVEGC